MTLDLTQVLVQRIHEGDAAAWEDLYLRYRDQLLLSIRCRLGTGLRARLESEDVLHSVMRDAMRDLADFEYRKKDALLHWLHVCVMRKIQNKAQYFAAVKRQREQPISRSIMERVGSQAAEPDYLDARYERLELAMAQLPAAMREVVLLRKVEGLSNREASETLGKSEDAVSKLFNRAIARLGILMGGTA